MPVGGGAYDAPAFGTNAICRKANPAGPATPGAVRITHPGWIVLPGDWLLRKPGARCAPLRALNPNSWRTMCAATAGCVREKRTAECRPYNGARPVPYCILPIAYCLTPIAYRLIPIAFFLSRMNSKNPVLAYTPTRDDCTQVQGFCSLLPCQSNDSASISLMTHSSPWISQVSQDRQLGH